jgi:D-alanine transfer protein
MKPEPFVRLHLVPCLSALALACLLYFIPSVARTFFPFDSPPYPADTAIYYDNIQLYPSELRIRRALHTGRSIVIVGSSEMHRSFLRAIPYRFFGNEVGYPAIGLGTAGNQSFSIAMQLAAMRQDLYNAKLVIMVSPSWFQGNFAGGTPSGAFLQFVPERLLYRTWFDKDVPQEFKDELGDYVVDHYKDFASPASILKLIYYNRRARLNPVRAVFDSPFIALNASYTGLKQSVMNGLYDYQLASAPFGLRQIADTTDAPIEQGAPRNPDWDQLMADALKRFSETSTNNRYAVENRVFADYVREKHFITPAKIVRGRENKELEQFRSLLSLLKNRRNKPFFVIQPLNPFIYPNLPDFDPTMAAVEGELQRAGMPYLNLYASARAQYVKGMLTDNAHLGDYGWYIVDRAIYEYFFGSRRMT